MAVYRVQGPDGAIHKFEGPDNANPRDIEAFAAQQFAPKPKVAPDAPVLPTDGMSGTDKFLAGTGKAFVDLARGAGQMVGAVDQQSVDEAKKRDAALMDTGAGIAGNITGNIAALLPASFVPGANTVAGASAIGGLTGALQPTATGESRLKNTVTSAALAGGAQYGLGKLAGAANNRLASQEASGALQASQNSVRDATLKASQDAGYVVPPSQAGSGLGSRVLEGISGKYKTNQAMGIKNQNVTDTLARKAMGLADDEPITREAMQGVRSAAFQKGYEPVANSGAVATDTQYLKALDKIAGARQGASRSFPNAVADEVTPFVEAMKVPSFDAGDAIKMTRLLRDKASDAYGAGNKELGKAYREASGALEDQLERHLAAQGKDGVAALKEFRDARTLMAKAHSVENAIVEAGGHVNAKALGKALQKGKPLSDELKTIGAFANNFGDVAGVPKSGWANPITALDAFQTAGMAGMGMGPMSVALPAARTGARALITSQPYQKMFASGPSYGPGLLDRMTPEMLAELERRGMGGLLGSAYAAQ